MSTDPLRAFLADELPDDAVPLTSTQRIVDAVVILRVEDMDDGAEAYTYTTTAGVHRAACLGMLDIAMDQVTTGVVEDHLGDDEP